MTAGTAAQRQRTIDANIKSLDTTKRMFDYLVEQRVGFVKINAPLYEKQDSGQFTCVGCSCHLGTECPPKNRGKHPVGLGWERHATTDWAIVHRWLLDGFSIGLYPLPGCRILGLDEDIIDSLEALFASVGEELPDMLTFGDVMRKKLHLYFRVPDGIDITTITNGKFPGGDVWRDGLVRHFVAPNMLHPEGRRAWNGVMDILEASPALIDALIVSAEAEKKAHEVAKAPTDAGWDVEAGSRHAFLLTAAARLRNAGLKDAPLVAALDSINHERCKPPKTLAEITKIAKDYSRKESVAEAPVITIDFGHGKREPEDDEAPPPASGTRPMTAFHATRVDWLWEGWMPRAEPVIIEGLGGEGKSTFVVDLMARLSRGDKMPDGQPNPYGGVPKSCIYITGEDDPDRILKPRFMAARADLDRIHYWDAQFTIPNDLQGLADSINATPDVVMVFIDPLFSHLDPGVNPNADVEIRTQVMDPLRSLARHLKVTVLIARHLNKKSGDELALRGSGSYGGLTGGARCVINAMTDPDDETKETKVIGVIKANYGRMPYPWKFQIVDDVILDDDGEDVKTSSIVWLERASKHLDQIAERSKSKAGTTSSESRYAAARAAADEDITDILAPGELLAREALDEMSRRGHSEKAARAAAGRCRVVITRPGRNTGPYVWKLPDAPEGRQGHFDLP